MILRAVIQSLIAVAFLTLGGAVRAETTTSKDTAASLQLAKPEAVGVSQSGLDQASRLIENAVTKGNLKGAVVLVARGDKIVLHHAVGWRDAKETVPMTKDTHFRMASNTKAITAAAVLHLVASNKLGLEDLVSRHLPSFDNAECSDITVHHLLTHTSGLRIKTLFIPPIDRRSTLQSEVNEFAKVGPAVKPGSSYSYSNPGYNTLAAIVEVISGKPFSDFCQATFYDPMGMKDTCHQESNADVSKLSSVFRRNADGTWQTLWRPGGPNTVPFVRGSGGMVSSARDYAELCRMFLAGGKHNGKEMLPERLVLEATRSQTDDIQKADKYGYGWQIFENGGVFSHGGSDGTRVYCDPNLDLMVLILTQSQKAKFSTWKFFQAVRKACRDEPSG